MPAQYEIKNDRWMYFAGYRQHPVDLLRSDAEQDCASCHGLVNGKPSLYGITCDACHGDPRPSKSPR